MAVSCEPTWHSPSPSLSATKPSFSNFCGQNTSQIASQCPCLQIAKFVRMDYHHSNLQLYHSEIFITDPFVMAIFTLVTFQLQKILWMVALGCLPPQHLQAERGA